MVNDAPSVLPFISELGNSPGSRPIILGNSLAFGCTGKGANVTDGRIGLRDEMLSPSSELSNFFPYSLPRLPVLSIAVERPKNVTFGLFESQALPALPLRLPP